MNKKAEKIVWYENPKYYLAGILVIWGFKLLFDAIHIYDIPELIFRKWPYQAH